MKIQLSDHFTYGKLIRFTLPSIAMMIFISIYLVIDGFFVSNFALCFAFLGFGIFVSGFFTVLNDGLTSALITFIRTLILQSAAIMMRPRLWGINGVWIFVVAAELMSLVLGSAAIYGISALHSGIFLCKSILNLKPSLLICSCDYIRRFKVRAAIIVVYYITYFMIINPENSLYVILLL